MSGFLLDLFCCRSNKTVFVVGLFRRSPLLTTTPRYTPQSCTRGLCSSEMNSAEFVSELSHRWLGVVRFFGSFFLKERT